MLPTFQTSLSEEDFSAMWGQLCEILSRLAGEASNMTIKRIQKDVMESSTQEIYIQAVNNSHQVMLAAASREKYQKAKSSPR